MPCSKQRPSEKSSLDKGYPLVQVAQVEPQAQAASFLIDELWLSSGVGIIGGAPKVFKTFFAVDLALSVASGTKAFGRFPTREAGPVIFYGAEDNLPALRGRFDHLALSRELRLDEIPLYLLDVPSLRLDRPQDIKRLRSTIDGIKPRLLVLDPFVRIAKIDENSAADVSTVLGYLREIQRAYKVAIIVVHHARKSPSAQLGYALRGSSDFAAWSDTNLFLSRNKNRLTLSLEHRCAPAPSPFLLTMQTTPAPHLVVQPSEGGEQMPLQPSRTSEKKLSELAEEVLKQLSTSKAPIPTVKLRKFLCKRKLAVINALHELCTSGHIVRSVKGWELSSSRFAEKLAVPCSPP
jgi:hypothetical protein